MSRITDNNNYKEISVTDIGGIRIGQVEDAAAGTGCTVFVCPDGMRAGLDVRGGGPASRESELLKPLAAAQFVHAIVLAGGSAFGLAAAGGVMRCLEERGIGFDVGVTKVPLVVQSDLFDLTVGDIFVRPDEAMGYRACKKALDAPNYRDGNFGAGCGATVGKLCGMERCMKTGIGSYALQIGELKIGAVIALNALGEIYDWKTGQKIAGVLTEDLRDLDYDNKFIVNSIAPHDNKFVADPAASDPPQFVKNTTLGVILTNARFEKTQLCKIAGMGHDGLARSIRPVHTSADGDSLYAVSLGDVAADQDVVGSLAAEVVSEAILNAAANAVSAYGFKAQKDLPPL